MKKRNLRDNMAGFSLLEVLIALVITGIITTAMFKAYITQHQNYVIQDDITNIQQGARACIDELSRHIRMTGNDVPTGIRSMAISNADPDTLTIIYRTDDCEVTLATTMLQPSSDLNCNGDVSCFDAGQWVYIFHPDSGGGEWFQITLVDPSSSVLRHVSMDLSEAYDADAIILAMDQIKFFVDNTTDLDHPSLMVELVGISPQVYAENISDLQFQYRLKNGNIVDVPILVDDVREVMISVTGRSEHEAYEVDDIDYRFRTYASSVNLRNFQ